VSVIEWFERLPEDEVDEYLRIHFEHEDGNKRKLTFTTHGSRYEEIVEKLRKSK
jgi:tRNA A37 threonylcarbamoyladenosine biosynthesis protein TsaE